jgi:hypothetical protein
LANTLKSAEKIKQRLLFIFMDFIVSFFWRIVGVFYIVVDFQCFFTLRRIFGVYTVPCTSRTFEKKTNKIRARVFVEVASGQYKKI